MDSQWKYYDFDANWPEVYRLWQSEKVQDALAPNIQSWCETDAYYNSDGKKPTWRRGDSLWQYSRTDYHWQRIMDRTNEHVHQHHLFKRFIEARARAGTPLPHDDELVGEAFQPVFDELEHDFEPKVGTLESMVLVMGANHLSDALLLVAERLFPEEQCVTLCDGKDEFVLVPRRRLIFDFQRFYFWKDGCKSLEPCDLVGHLWPLDLDEDDPDYEDDSGQEEEGSMLSDGSVPDA